MTPEEWSLLLGDDIAYWMGNPFMDAEAKTAKVVSWLEVASSRAVREVVTRTS